MEKLSNLTIISMGIAATLLGFVAVAPISHVVAQDDGFATAPCTDSEGATTAFFCQPLSAKGKLVAACNQKKPKDLGACQMTGASNYCSARGYARPLSYNLDPKGNLTELVCSRAPVMSVAAAAPSASAEDPNWQPLHNANILGYDHREFREADRNDWRSCKAACDANLLSTDACCITGIKGMASARNGSEGRRTMRTPEELKRLGRRTQGAAEDEVGRRAEDAARRGIGDILNN